MKAAKPWLMFVLLGGMLAAGGCEENGEGQSGEWPRRMGNVPEWAFTFIRCFRFFSAPYLRRTVPRSNKQHYRLRPQCPPLSLT
ncbi:hypothetical protein [Paenibacillus mesotrionivorans]|uniref:Uncharacterized protein n=1 Tax=Paenibacillus mesotrionivorans TaxID=3160968 RepID=A0ACC7NTZ0_9BACL